MAKAEVNLLPLGTRTLAASINHKGECYFCFIGFPLPAELPPGLEPIDATPGLFSSVIYESDVKATATAAQIRDIIQDQYSGANDYSGHDLNDILILFPKMYFFQKSKNTDQIFLQQLERVAGSYVARGYQGYPLDLSVKSLQSLADLFEAGPDTVPYSLPLQGLLSYNFPSLFLDLYRCLEQLYSAPKLLNLAETMTHKGSLADLASLLEKCLSWRPKEEEALSALLSHISPKTRKSIVSAMCLYSPRPEATAQKCASLIYKARNSYVHFRPAIKVEIITTENWSKIISAMCISTQEVYFYFGELFLVKERN